MLLLEWIKRRSAEIAGANARIEQSRADFGQSRLFPNPVADFSLGGVNVAQSNPRGLGFKDTANYGVGVAELLEIGKRGPRIESARLRERASREDYLTVLGQKMASARLALARAIYLKSKQTTLDENLESAKKVIDLERSRLEHGDISKNDFDRLLLDTTTLELEVARTRTEFEISLTDARAVLFAPVDVDGAKLDDLDAALLLPSGLKDAEEVLEHRADVLSLRITEQSARQDEVLARRMIIPDLNFHVGYLHDYLTVAGNQEHTIAFGVALSIPLFDRGQHGAAKAAGRAMEIESAARATIAEAQADLAELKRRRTFLESALDRLQKEDLPRSTEVLDATLKAFNRGQVSLTDLILARRTHLSLVVSVMDLRFDNFNVKNDLRRVLGLDAELDRHENESER